MERRLYRSASNKTVLGVLGGLGEYWNVDPVLIRVGFVFAMFVLPPVILAYFICYFIMPLEPSSK